jgi:hypothetical protein
MTHVSFALMVMHLNLETRPDYNVLTILGSGSFKSGFRDEIKYYYEKDNSCYQSKKHCQGAID